jgi:hypothetical protein
VIRETLPGETEDNPNMRGRQGFSEGAETLGGLRIANTEQSNIEIPRTVLRYWLIDILPSIFKAGKLKALRPQADGPDPKNSSSLLANRYSAFDIQSWQTQSATAAG